MIFELKEINEAHSKVESGADFPKYIQDLIKLGVTKYETLKTDEKTWEDLSESESYVKTGDPVVTMNYVRGPSQFAYGFNHAFAKENGAQIIIIIPLFIFIMKNKFPFEKIFIIQKVNLQTGIR